MGWNVAFFHKCIKIFLACWTKGGHVGLHVGIFFITNMLKFFHGLLISQRGSKVSESKFSFKIYPISWVPTGKHCSISWSSVSISSFVYNKLPWPQSLCCVFLQWFRHIIQKGWRVFALFGEVMTKFLWIFEALIIWEFLQMKSLVIGLHAWNFHLHYINLTL